MRNRAAGPVSIGRLRLSASITAVTAGLVLAGCGSSAAPPTQTLPASGAPTNARVPAQVTVLTTTRGLPGHKPSTSMTTTLLGKIATVAALLDSLHPVRKGVVNCPNMPVEPKVTFLFRSRRGGPELARASMPATGPKGECPGITFKAQGHAQEHLYAQPSFLHDADRVLGIGMARD